MLTLLEHVQCPAVSDTMEYHACSTLGSPAAPIMHQHDCYEICLIRYGEFSIISKDICCRKLGPCLVIYNQNCPHAQFDNRKTAYERFCIQLMPTLLPIVPELYQDFSCRITKSAIVIPLSETRMDWLYLICFRMLSVLQEENCTETDSSFLIPLQCLLMELNSFLQMETEYPVHRNVYILEAMTYIRAHLTEKISIQDIAAYLHIGKTKLCTDFQNFASMSVHQYIIGERFSRAQQYLQKEYSLDEIALLCGFGTTSHFIYTFQKYFSISPTQFRMAHNKQRQQQ